MRPDFDEWFVVECPARADLSGGWSDTPPITYEHGGAVCNVALKVDGQVSQPPLFFIYNRLMSHRGGKEISLYKA